MPRKSRISERRLFAASIRFVVGDAAIVEPRRGAWITRVDARTGDVASTFFEPTRRLFANVGDELLVCRADADDDNAYAEVIAVEQDGWIERLRLRFVGLSIWPGAATCWLLASKLGATRRSAS
jgi:hypothetical protein